MAKKISRKEKTDLRERFQEKLMSASESLKDSSLKVAEKLIHVLRAQQIELELKNEELTKRQSELIASRDYYADLYDNAPTGFISINTKGVILGANKTLQVMLGQKSNLQENQLLSSLIFSKDQDNFYIYHKKLFDTKNPHTCELRMIRKNGSHFWVRFDGKIIGNEHVGERKGCIVVSDISKRIQADDESTEWKQVEEKLKKIQDRYHQAEILGKIGHWEWDQIAYKMATCSHQFANIMIWM